MSLSQFFRNHFATLGLIATVAIPLLLVGGAPDPEDCPDGIWIRNSGSCGREYWECSTTGDEVDIRVESHVPLQFERNAGQAESQYEFLTHSGGQSVLLTGGDAVLGLDSPRGAVYVRMDLDGAESPQVVGEDQLPGLTNYFLGSDPRAWLTNIVSYRRIRYKSVYPGIDVVYYGTQGELEHDFVVSPGADPANIRMSFKGAQGVRLDGDGSATIQAGGQSVKWHKPVIYQESGGKRHAIAGGYRLDESGALAFTLGAYDRAKPLVIDPVISYATFWGRTGADGASRVGVDAAGNAYVVGYTQDSAFPRAGGAISSGLGPGNIIVTKLSPDGTVLYSTFIGGSSRDGALAVAVDRDGNAYIAGAGSSPDFPTTAGAIKRALSTAPNDPFECTITKLNAAGNALLYSTFLGGTGRDTCIGIAVDATGAAYVTGNTGSSNFPVSETAPRRTLASFRDGFLTKINPTGTAIVYSTLLGGNGRDSGAAVAVDAAGAAYVVGNSESSFGFPITPGAFQTTYRGTTSTAGASGDAFVLKMNPEGTQVVYGTFLGGSRDDMAFAIAVDPQGNAYVAGNTTSTNFPTTASAYQTAYAGIGNNNVYRGGDAFITKLNPTGTTAVYSTLVGGAQDDWITSISVDATGSVHFVGASSSPNFPVTTDAHQRTYAGSDPVLGFPTGDAILGQLNTAGSALIYATFLGGSADEIGMGIALDSSNNAVISGVTRSRNFPVTPGAAQPLYGGATTNFLPLGDLFIARFAATGGGNPAGNVQLRGVASAASYAGAGVAPGEIIILGGTNIGPANLATLAVAQERVTTSLGGTRVLFDEVPAPLIYVSGGQSSAVVPYAVARRQQTQIVVEYQGQRSAPLTMPVVASKPALFSANSSGSGPGAILNEDFSVNSPTNRSAKGRVVQLFGTGEGQTNPEGVDGQLATAVFPRPVLPVSVTIGGRAADVLYAGAAPGGVAGFMQINAKIPEDSPSGNLDVVVTVGSARSQAGLTVAVE